MGEQLYNDKRTMTQINDTMTEITMIQNKDTMTQKPSHRRDNNDRNNETEQIQ